MFRAFHTLKGAAAVVELPAMTMTVTPPKTCLRAIGGRLVTSPAIIDQVAAGQDFAVVDEFAAHQAEARRADDARAIVARLEELVRASDEPETASRQGAPASTVSRRSGLPGWSNRNAQ